MTDAIFTSAKTLLAAGLVASLTLPALAAAPPPDGQCQNRTQAKRSLAAMNFKNIAADPRFDQGQFYFFVASNTLNGRQVIWHIIYDTCGREIVSQEDQR